MLYAVFLGATICQISSDHEKYLFSALCKISYEER